MAMQLPRFEKTSCRILTVCGRIKEEENPLPKLLPQKKPLVAAYRAAGQNVYLRVLPGGKKHTHLHVDCALRAFFGKDRGPKATAKKADIVKILGQAAGLTIDVGICGGFLVPLSDLPEGGLVRSLSTEQKTGDMSVRLTSGECKIDGAPVRRLFWSIGDEQKDVFVRLEAERQEKVDDQYLMRSLDWIEKQFSLFVLGKTADGNA